MNEIYALIRLLIEIQHVDLVNPCRSWNTGAIKKFYERNEKTLKEMPSSKTLIRAWGFESDLPPKPEILDPLVRYLVKASKDKIENRWDGCRDWYDFLGRVKTKYPYSKFRIIFEIAIQTPRFDEEKGIFYLKNSTPQNMLWYETVGNKIWEELQNPVEYDKIEIPDCHSDLPESASYIEIIGRHEVINEIWDLYYYQQFQGVIALTGYGGMGKSLIINKLISDFIKPLLGTECDFYYSWSSSGQGAAKLDTGAEKAQNPSFDLFFDHAWEWLGGDTSINYSDPIKKADELYKLFLQYRVCIILDGIEVVQDKFGKFSDEALGNFLKLVASNGLSGNSMLLVTSREEFKDLESYVIKEISLEKEGKNFYPIQLKGLQREEGRTLLHQLGIRDPQYPEFVQDQEDELAAAVDFFFGNPLALILLGKLLWNYYPIPLRENGEIASFGDAREWKRIYYESYIGKEIEFSISNPESEKDNLQKHLTALLKHYEEKWTDDKPEKSLMYLISIFDRPVGYDTGGELTHLISVAQILTKYTEGIKIKDRLTYNLHNHMIILGKTGIIELMEDKSCVMHPLIREYFQTKYYMTHKDDYLYNHGKLSEILFNKFHTVRINFEEDKPGLANLQPLIRAIYHRCEAREYDEAYTLCLTTDLKHYLENRLRAYRTLYIIHCWIVRTGDPDWNQMEITPKARLVLAKAKICYAIGFFAEAGRLVNELETIQPTAKLAQELLDFFNNGEIAFLAEPTHQLASEVALHAQGFGHHKTYVEELISRDLKKLNIDVNHLTKEQFSKFVIGQIFQDISNRYILYTNLFIQNLDLFMAGLVAKENRRLVADIGVLTDSNYWYLKPKAEIYFHYINLLTGTTCSKEVERNRDKFINSIIDSDDDIYGDFAYYAWLLAIHQWNPKQREAAHDKLKLMEANTGNPSEQIVRQYLLALFAVKQADNHNAGLLFKNLLNSVHKLERADYLLDIVAEAGLFWGQKWLEGNEESAADFRLAKAKFEHLVNQTQSGLHRFHADLFTLIETAQSGNHDTANQMAETCKRTIKDSKYGFRLALVDGLPGGKKKWPFTFW